MRKIYISILFLISLSFAGKAQWNPASPMSTTRSEHVSANLTDGSVLVAGGWDNTSNITTAEIYDPVNDAWNSTATQMNSPHTWGAAVTLANGKVLVIGGYTGTVNTTACELYDPVADTWTTTGSLTTGRSWFTATLLNNGKVLVAAGFNPNVGYQVSTAELYDPVAGTWSSGGTLGVPRSYHSATLLNNGKVLVAGGLGTVGTLNQLTSAELYDPSSNSWAPAADMNVRRDFFGMTKLADGTVMAAGGRSFISGSNYIGLSDVETYDAGADVWNPGTPLPTRVCYNHLITLNDGRVLSVAGLDSLHNASPFVTVKGISYISDVTASSWTAAPPAMDGRFEFCANLMADGRVIIEGGENDNSAELYGTASGVSQIGNTQSFVIYPNPAKNELRVMSDGLWVNPVLELTNILGERVYHTQLTTHNLPTGQAGSQLKTTIDVSAFGAGIYFVKIQDSKQTIVKKLTVVN